MTRTFEQVMEEANLKEKPIDYRIAWHEGYQAGMNHAKEIVYGKEQK